MHLPIVPNSRSHDHEQQQTCCNMPSRSVVQQSVVPSRCYYISSTSSTARTDVMFFVCKLKSFHIIPLYFKQSSNCIHCTELHSQRHFKKVEKGINQKKASAGILQSGAGCNTCSSWGWQGVQCLQREDYDSLPPSHSGSSHILVAPSLEKNLYHRKNVFFSYIRLF